MPARSGASKRWHRLIKKRTNPPKPQARSLGAGYAHVIHRPFPTDWGQFRSATVTARPRVMAQGFHPCRLQRSVPGFPTELSTESPVVAWQRALSWDKQKSDPQALIDQKMISTLQATSYAACRDMPPCFPQPASHDSWTSLQAMDTRVCHSRTTKRRRRVRQVVHMPPPATNMRFHGSIPGLQCPPRYALRTSSLTNSSCPVPVMRICPLTIT